jgi:acetyltransferase
MKKNYNTSFSYKLNDNTEVLYRQIKSEDKKGIQEGFKFLSNNSIYTRFFSPLKRLTTKQLIHLTDVDQKNHLAWCVTSPAYPEIPGLGTCRFIRSKEFPNTAEFAITVIDDFQNKGLGTEFLALLYILALFHDIKILKGSALNANLKLIKRFKNIGASISWHHGECDINIPVFNDYNEFPINRYSELFINLVKVFYDNLTANK